MIFPNISTSEPPTSESPQLFAQEDYRFLIVPLVVIVLIMLLSLLVYCMARRRRLDIMRRNILSLYEFDSNEQEWESLNIYDNPNYNTSDYTTTNF